MDSLLPENHEFWRTDPMPLHFLLEHHSNPSYDEARHVHVNVLLQFSRGYIIDNGAGCVPSTTVCTDRDPQASLVKTFQVEKR